MCRNAIAPGIRCEIAIKPIDAAATDGTVVADLRSDIAFAVEISLSRVPSVWRRISPVGPVVFSFRCQINAEWRRYIGAGKRTARISHEHSGHRTGESQSAVVRCLRGQRVSTHWHVGPN